MPLKFSPTGMNNRSRLLHGDCLKVLSRLPDNLVDMIYIDPPFCSGKNWGEFDDFSDLSEYLAYMEIRLTQLKRVLKPTGVLWLHCDLSAVHYLKVLMDELFGIDKFLNQITWQRTGGHHDSKVFGKVTDHILVYGKKLVNIDAVREPPDEGLIKRKYTQKDERGVYQPVGMGGKSLSGGGYEYTFLGHTRIWACPESTMLSLYEDNRLHIPKGGLPYKKIYLKDHKGVLPSNLWTDIARLNGMAEERVGYPTQKPVELLERIVLSSTQENDIVLDAFCGSGTTLVAAKKLGRKWVGIDKNPTAIKIARRRIHDTSNEAEIQQ